MIKLVLLGVFKEQIGVNKGFPGQAIAQIFRTQISSPLWPISKMCVICYLKSEETTNKGGLLGAKIFQRNYFC